MSEWIQIRKTKTRAGQIEALERATGLEGNSAIVDFALGYAIANLVNQQEETMGTGTVFARGSDWSASQLYDSAAWGDVTDEQAKDLGNLVVERFELLCAQAGDPTIHWLPNTSEVIGEVYGQDTDEHSKWDPVHDVDLDLDELRDQAMSAVWEAVCGDQDSPAWPRVTEILGE
jgi:hypothetical protein